MHQFYPPVLALALLHYVSIDAQLTSESHREIERHCYLPHKIVNRTLSNRYPWHGIVCGLISRRRMKENLIMMARNG